MYIKATSYSRLLTCIGAATMIVLLRIRMRIRCFLLPAQCCSCLRRAGWSAAAAASRAVVCRTATRSPQSVGGELLVPLTAIYRAATRIDGQHASDLSLNIISTGGRRRHHDGRKRAEIGSRSVGRSFIACKSSVECTASPVTPVRNVSFRKSSSACITSHPRARFNVDPSSTRAVQYCLREGIQASK